MSRIDAGNASSLTASRLATTSALSSESLRRLSAGLIVNHGGSSASTAPDSLSLSAAASGGGNTEADGIAGLTRPSESGTATLANSAQAALDEIGNSLAEIQQLVLGAQADATLSRDQLLAIQSNIDAHLASVDKVARAGGLARLPFFGGGKTWEVAGRSYQLLDEYRVAAPGIAPGQTLNLDVVVTQSAQTAGLYLDFGATSLDLENANSAFTLEVKGPHGTQQISFTSGTTVWAIGDALRAIGADIGVDANGSSTGVTLNSSVDGANGFVSVRVVDDGGLVGNNASGLYRVDHRPYGDAPAYSSRVALNSQTAQDGVTDHGQDVAGSINGIHAVGIGRTLSIHTAGLDASLTLTRDGSSPNIPWQGGVRGPFTALRLLGVNDASAGTIPDPSDSDGLSLPQIGSEFLGRGKYDFASLFGQAEASWDLGDLRGGRGANVVDGYIEGAVEIIAQARLDLDSIKNAISISRERGPAQDPARATPTNDAPLGVANSADASEIARIVRQAALASTSGLGARSLQARPEKVLSLLTSGFKK